jgi:hypothetical protein
MLCDSLNADELTIVLRHLGALQLCRVARVSRSFQHASYSLRRPFRTFGSVRRLLSQRDLTKVTGIGAVEMRYALVSTQTARRAPVLYDLRENMSRILQHVGGWHALHTMIDKRQKLHAEWGRIGCVKKQRRETLQRRRQDALNKRHTMLDTAIAARGLASSFCQWRCVCLQKHGYDPVLISNVLKDFYTKLRLTQVSFSKVAAIIDRFASASSL